MILELSEHDFISVHDTIVHHFNGPIDNDHVITLVKMLPDHIVSEGLEWGFSDTVVRDDIYRYISDNKKLVSQRLFG
jgi:hypothetical protein